MTVQSLIYKLIKANPNMLTNVKSIKVEEEVKIELKEEEPCTVTQK